MAHFCAFETKNGTALVNYYYLVDGTKLSALQDSGEALDFGTGYIDFGARQYNPSLRRWMTPDPLSEKYYGISPYAFCNNNPVNLVDPDGQKLVSKMNDIEYQWKTVDGEWGFYDQDDKLYMAEEDAFINIVSKYLLDLMSTNIGSTIVNNLVDNDEAVFIAGGRNCYDSNSNTVGFNPYKIDYVPTEGGLNFNAQAIFIHELAHALYDITGGEQKVWFPVQQEIGSKNVMISEIYTTHIENLFRSEVNLPLRTYYAKMFDGTPYGHAIVKSKKGIRYSRYYRSDNTTNFKVIRKKHAYVY